MPSIKQLASSLLFLTVLPIANALKLDVVAHPGHESKARERCVRNFVAKDQLVVVTAIVDGQRHDGQMLNMHVCNNNHGKDLEYSDDSGQIRDAVGNEYHKPKDVVGENRYAFTSHSDSAFDVCFENLITQGCMLFVWIWRYKLTRFSSPRIGFDETH